MLSAIMLCFFEMAVLGMYGRWMELAFLNVINIALILSLFVWDKRPLTFSWLVIGFFILLIQLSPTVMSSSIALLTLFMCYTMMPLQLTSSAVAAGLITLASICRTVFDTQDVSQVIFIFYVEFCKLVLNFCIRLFKIQLAPLCITKVVF